MQRGRLKKKKKKEKRFNAKELKFAVCEVYIGSGDSTEDVQKITNEERHSQVSFPAGTAIR